MSQDQVMSDEGGDEACWLPRFCEECGQLLERPDEHPCVRSVGLDRVGAPPGPGGVVWALSGQRQLEVNLVVLEPGGAIAEHPNTAVDVAILVLDGSVAITVDGVRRVLTVHDLLFVPRGARRGATAAPGGVRYLAIHIARPGPTIGRE
jgi:quercetin dioxygenase-like cupin family protein